MPGDQSHLAGVYDDAIVDCIEQSIRERQYPPSVREIAASIGVAPGTAQLHLARMTRRGLIEVDRGVARGIRVARMVADTEEL